MKSVWTIWNEEILFSRDFYDSMWWTTFPQPGIMGTCVTMAKGRGNRLRYSKEICLGRFRLVNNVPIVR